MDIVTQGLLGASLSSAGAQKETTRKAALVGFVSGMLADADIFIRSSEDPLLNIEYHRHFTHSIAFIPIGGLIAALLLWPFFRRYFSFKKLYLMALLGYAGSGFLDACTSYGTMLLWPFSDQRISWSIISTLDPFFSLTLIIALLFAWKYKNPRLASSGLILVVFYLALGFIQNQRASFLMRDQAELRGHRPESLLVKPTMANLVLWRSVYEHNGKFYVDGVRVGFFPDNRLYPGESIERYEPKHDKQNLPESSTLKKDIDRFIYFSEGYVSYDPSRQGVLIDVRYSMLPNTLEPLWGIDLNLELSRKHVDFIHYRDRPENMKEKFIMMLLGHKLPAIDSK